MLLIVEESGTRRVITIADMVSAFSAGSAPESSVRSTERGILSRHLLLQMSGDECEIYATQGGNPVFLNGIEVRGPDRLRVGDTLRLGNMAFSITQRSI
jgi:hypothetical protein